MKIKIKIFDRKPSKIKNYAIWLRYDSRSGTHNMYREYRDLTPEGAVTQLYRDMGSRHRARSHSVQVMRVETVAASKCKRPNILQYHVRIKRFIKIIDLIYAEKKLLKYYLSNFRTLKLVFHCYTMSNLELTTQDSPPEDQRLNFKNLDSRFVIVLSLLLSFTPF